LVAAIVTSHLGVLVGRAGLQPGNASWSSRPAFNAHQPLDG
jgi:hypothetical protein